MVHQREILDIFTILRYSVLQENVHHLLEGGLIPAGLGGAEKNIGKKKEDKASETTWTTRIPFVIDLVNKSERNSHLKG